MDLIIHELTFSEHKLLTEAATKKGVPIELYMKDAVLFAANKDMGKTHDTAFFNKYITISPNKYIPKKELYEQYKIYTKSRASYAISNVMFNKQVKKILPVHNKRVICDTPTGKVRMMAWGGIGWKAVDFGDDDENKV